MAVSLHVLVFLALVYAFTFVHPLDIADESAPAVPVDLVTIAPKTNLIAHTRPAPKLEAEVKPPALQPSELKPQEPSVPDEEEAPPPDTAPSEPVIKAPPPPPVPKTRPQPQQDTKKFSVDSIAALLNKVAPQPAAQTNARVADRNTTAFGAQNAMTADLQDALRSQIRPCWSPPIGAPHPEQLIVDFDLFLAPDGSVQQPPQLDANSAAQAAGNPYLRAAADAARRAIYECAPYKLPADKYALWREINPFRFDPRQMVGQ